MHKHKLQLQQQQQQVAAAVAAAQTQQAAGAQPAGQVQAAQGNPQMAAVAAPRPGAVLTGTTVANLQVARLVSSSTPNVCFYGRFVVLFLPIARCFPNVSLESFVLFCHCLTS